MLNNWLPLPNKDMEKKCRRTALLLKRVNCGPQDTKRGKWIIVLIVKVKYLPRVIIGGVHLELRFHGSHNHDGKENKKKWKDGNNLRHNLHGNSPLSHCSVINFLSPLPPDLPQSNIVSNFSRLLQGGHYSSPLPPPKKKWRQCLCKIWCWRRGGGGKLRGKQGIYVGNAMVAHKRPTFSCKKKNLS